MAAMLSRPQFVNSDNARSAPSHYMNQCWKYNQRYWSLWWESTGVHSQRSVTQSFGVFLDMSLNKWLNKQWNCLWFEAYMPHPNSVCCYYIACGTPEAYRPTYVIMMIADVLAPKHWWPSTQPNRPVHNPAAYYRAAHNLAARWCVAGLCAARLGCVQGHPWHDDIFRVTGPLCGEFTGPGEFPTQRPVRQSFDVFFGLRLNKRLSKQPWGWWFETPS